MLEAEISVPRTGLKLYLDTHPSSNKYQQNPISLDRWLEGIHERIKNLPVSFKTPAPRKCDLESDCTCTPNLPLYTQNPNLLIHGAANVS